MAVKTITIREEVYRKLLAMKGDTESFSDLLDRLARKMSIAEFFGALADEITEADVRSWREKRRNEWVRILDR